MSYIDLWGDPLGRVPSNLGERQFSRKLMPAWDAKWHRLTPKARLAFLEHAKVTGLPISYSLQRNSNYLDRAGVEARMVPPDALKELIAEGFLVLHTAALKKGEVQRAFAPNDVSGFLTRVRSLRRFRLLAPGAALGLSQYIETWYTPGSLEALAYAVLHKAGITDAFRRRDEISTRYLVRRQWLDWAVARLEDPLTKHVLDEVRKADAPIPIVAVDQRIARIDPVRIRAALDTLIANLVVFEDLDPKTWDIVVGLLPAVREDLARAAIPRQRPPLEVCASPREVGPTGSFVVEDLRTFLLEVVSEPPRLRQDGVLFQKELERFEGLFDPLPAWLPEALQWGPEARSDQATRRALAIGMVRKKSEGKRTWLEVSPKGQKWLAGDLAAQYRAVYDYFQSQPPDLLVERFLDERDDDFEDDFDDTTYYDDGRGDSHFLGISLEVVKVSKRKTTGYLPAPDAKARKEVRDALLQVFEALPLGTFHPMSSVIAHASFGAANPLNLGRDPRELTIAVDGRPIPAIEEFREEAARRCLELLIRQRLIPLGGVQAAINEKGWLCIARTPKLDAYFGRKVADDLIAGAPAADSRVVVQPDFSIVVIGLNPAPAAALAPFCERTSRGAGAGALTLKITRESVIKAVANGLKPAEILDRLQRHASHAVPANVLRQVGDWSAWVRNVSAATLTVLRCSDRDTADRVAGVLKRQAERLNDTTVALETRTLSTADRAKLQDQGILIRKGNDTEIKPQAAKKKPRRRT